MTNPTPHKIKRVQTIVEFDENTSSMYVFVPPYNHKNPPSVANTKIAMVGEQKVVNIDYDSGGKICGIEIFD